MKKRDALELTRRMKKDACTFTRMCGCYVDPGKEKVLTFGKTFLNLEDEEFYKYLEIAKKTLSGAFGDNLMNFDFPREMEEAGGTQQFLMGLRESKLKNEELVDRFYDLVIESYQYAGSYLILLFHDVYDVMSRTTDNQKLDESEEVYEYLLCSICPIVLSKPALGYLEAENTIGPRIRDKIVSLPESGFLFPAFNERSADIHAAVFYTKDTKEPHNEFVERILGCESKLTATEQKKTFRSIVTTAMEEEEAEETFTDIQKNLSDMVTEVMEEKADAYEDTDLILGKKEVERLMTESGLDEGRAAAIASRYEDAFERELPAAEHLIDAKVLRDGEMKLEKRALKNRVRELEERIAFYDEEEKTYDVVLRVKPEKEAEIRSEIVDGERCLVIPMKENEYAVVNGINKKI